MRCWRSTIRAGSRGAVDMAWRLPRSRCSTRRCFRPRCWTHRGRCSTWCTCKASRWRKWCADYVRRVRQAGRIACHRVAPSHRRLRSRSPTLARLTPSPTRSGWMGGVWPALRRGDLHDDAGPPSLLFLWHKPFAAQPIHHQSNLFVAQRFFRAVRRHAIVVVAIEPGVRRIGHEGHHPFA